MHANRPAKVEILEEELSYAIVGVFFSLYNRLGFGFLESIYVRGLEILLRKKGYLVERQFPVDIFFEGELIGQHRIDLLVERRIIVEVKSTERMTDVPKRQLRNYLAATGLRVGLILHFGPRAEYHRVIGPARSTTLPESPHSTITTTTHANSSNDANDSP